MTINETVEEAKKKILALEEGWDGEDSKTIEPSTFIHIKLFINLCINCSFFLNKKLAIPNISPCNDGSIDIYWKAENKYRILVNVKKDGLITAYGDDYSEDNKISAKYNFRDLKSRVSNSIPCYIAALCYED